MPFAALACLCAAVPVGLRVALPPEPTPTPFVSTFEQTEYKAMAAARFVKTPPEWIRN